MSGITLFCKSYRNDLERAVSLVESIRTFNRSSLPLSISVPLTDLALFKNRIGTEDVQWLTDEDIISADPELSINSYHALPGQLSQQIVKAEFWRANALSSCLCIDSDSIFIRDFDWTDFLYAGDIPYTVMHEGKAFHEFCMSNGVSHAVKTLISTQEEFRGMFVRKGPLYNFGPFPVTWHRSVWEDLSEQFLKPRNMTIAEAIRLHPSEAFWYGEALLKYHSIPIVPREPFFKAYLYLEEYEHDKDRGVTHEMLSTIYSGIVYQSNWHPKRLKGIKNIAYKYKKAIRGIGQVLRFKT
ncbi:MAG: DUF6492 family protein [Nitrospirota bacterium]